MHDINSSNARDFMQKAKIQWAIEGDENSKFFHGIINCKRANLAIKGVMVDGEWVDDPCRVKEEFRLHFANRFRAPVATRYKLNYTFPNKLSSDQMVILESLVSRDEVRNASWRESLHLSVSKAIEAGFYKGNKIGSSLNLSHLFYADDTIFIGEWSPTNLSGITHILHCFSLLSGLSINIQKSHLLGVGVRSEYVNDAALNLGCLTMKTPFKYLGVMAGENKDCSVAEKLYSVSSSLRRPVRGGVENSQLILLQEHIEGTILSNMEDRWVWDLNGE
uniref:RNA-directed DNA polymerase, eukaryota n=1 Tax=Tanacetum cinerariifolium TaxID=118510 RepID=A0A6L2K2V6_TANCI|nr:RNA-directed DNA polymerase, eukaryota [Tanacetum cinerariifolium]